MKGEDDHENVLKLASKYRVSWHQATEVQRRHLCQRFGLQYTNVDDEELLVAFAKAQQKDYTDSKPSLRNERMQLIKTAMEAEEIKPSRSRKTGRRKHSEIALAFE